MKFILTNGQFVEANKLTTPLGDYVVGSAKEWAADIAKDMIMGTLIALRDIFVELIGAVALVGGGLLILLRVAGYDNGYKYAGVLFVANVLIKFLLGGA